MKLHKCSSYSVINARNSQFSHLPRYVCVRAYMCVCVGVFPQDVNYNEGVSLRSSSPSAHKKSKAKKKTSASKKSKDVVDSSNSSSDSDSDGKRKIRGRPRAGKKDDVPGFTNNEVRR